MSTLQHYQIKEIQKMGDQYALIRLEAPEIAAKAVPGQFLNLQLNINESDDPLLKRPFSIHHIDGKNGIVELLIKIVGRGTRMLVEEGLHFRKLQVLGPLGQGFQTIHSGKALLIGGGIGVAPLKELARVLVKNGVEVTLLLGITEPEDLILAERVKEFSPQIIVAKENTTSKVRQGLVTELLKEEMGKTNYQQYYACGPEPMLRAVQQLLDKENAKLQMALEEKMGCGVGLCFSCVCKVKKENDSDKWKYERVCTCGPVFRGDEVILDD